MLSSQLLRTQGLRPAECSSQFLGAKMSNQGELSLWRLLLNALHAVFVAIHSDLDDTHTELMHAVAPLTRESGSQTLPAKDIERRESIIGHEKFIVDHTLFTQTVNVQDYHGMTSNCYDSTTWTANAGPYSNSDDSLEDNLPPPGPIFTELETQPRELLGGVRTKKIQKALETMSDLISLIGHHSERVHALEARFEEAVHELTADRSRPQRYDLTKSHEELVANAELLNHMLLRLKWQSTMCLSAVNSHQLLWQKRREVIFRTHPPFPTYAQPRPELQDLTKYVREKYGMGSVSEERLESMLEEWHEVSRDQARHSMDHGARAYTLASLASRLSHRKSSAASQRSMPCSPMVADPQVQGQLSTSQEKEIVKQMRSRLPSYEGDMQREETIEEAQEQVEDSPMTTKEDSAALQDQVG